MKKLTSLLLCMVLLLAMLPMHAAAAELTCMEAGVTVVDDGTVTVVVSGKLPADNARLRVDFDSDYLTYLDSETPFAVHSVKAEGEKLTIGLANPSGAGQTQELIRIRFAMTGHWDRTDITVTAERYDGRAVNEAVTLTAQGGGYRFQDVTAGQWFYKAVDYMASEGYILGISESHFGPALQMNRASFVTLLGRLEGVENTGAQTGFVDVPADSFYAGYVAWAVEKGITNGIDAAHFAPTASINRAQMVTFLYRYVCSEGIDVTVAEPEALLAQFPDSDTLPDWAVEPFAWAIDRGIINGLDGKLAPTGTANRAQVAVMLYRFFFEN